MSMYNMLFGENPAADIFLELLGFSRNNFFWYRDCYLVEEDGKKVIAVYTRGGGCNRVANDTNFSEHPNFLRDADDEFDNTYCSYFFSVPPSGAKIIATLVHMEAAKRNPKEAWDKLFTALKEGGADDPMTKHALKVGKKIFEAIGEELVEGKNAVVEV